MNLEESLDRVVSRYDELQALAADHPNPGSSEYVGMHKEISDLTQVVDAISTLRKAQQEARDLEDLEMEGPGDAEMKTLVEAESESLRHRISDLEHEVRLLLLPKDEADARNAIVEVRAGTGGEEAALFAAELFAMYQRYAALHGWRFEVLDYSDTGIGGCKEASGSVAGKGVFARLKFESGVHRVQRIPVTESGGRIHTSAATVAVLPEAEEVEVQVDEKDLRVDTYRSQGAGGQHVNTTDSAVRITHLPSGIVVQCQDEKSQHKNKARAMKILRSRLLEHEQEKAAAERASERRSQVGSGDRSERIRTYNFPQSRVTDHRVGVTLHKLDQVIEGNMDELLDAVHVGLARAAEQVAT